MKAQAEGLRACRSCGAEDLRPVLDLGAMPLADAFPDAAGLHQAEARFPLRVVFCPDCSLVQITETIPPDMLFGNNFPYYSSYSETLLTHSREHAASLTMEQELDGRSLVVEIGSNDGYLLRYFQALGIPVLGIDPAAGPAAVAVAAGVPTLRVFFGRALAEQLREEGYEADVILANNVLAHVADVHGLIDGMVTLLAEHGVVEIEVPYVRNFVELCQFDTVYHEHLCYFSLIALDRLFRPHGLFPRDVCEVAQQGGSLRLRLTKTDAPLPSVVALLAEERRRGLNLHAYYRGLNGQVAALKERIGRLLRDLKDEGRRLAAYGAAAKGSVLLNVLEIGPDILDFVVDRNPAKQGRLMPGTHVPIRPVEDLLTLMPDCVLILPWNLTGEILAQQRAYRARGGRFIVPLPNPVMM